MQSGRAAAFFIVFSTLAMCSQAQSESEFGSGTPNTSCANDFPMLEKALLQTGDNKVQLLKAFYPPRLSPATFVMVHYRFLDKNENVICTKSWMWSSETFYLLQPPTIFQFMSLLFAMPLATVANITFKDDCRELVTWNENGSCTCTSNSLLDILTQRLKLYAKFNKPEDIEVDHESLGAVVCEDERVKEYHTQTELTFYAIAACGPIFAIILLVVMVCSVRTKIDAALEMRKNHANLAALVLTGLVFVIFVLALDIQSTILVYQGKHEFTEYTDFSFEKVYSLSFEKVVTALDALVALVALLIVVCLLVRLCISCCCKCNCCSEICALRLLASLCVAPLLCIATHCGYIIIGWVTHDQQHTAAIFIYTISFFYYFIFFRQMYIMLSNLLKYCCGKQTDEQNMDEERKDDSDRETIPLHPRQISGESESMPNFNFTVFFIEIVAGILPVGIEIAVVYSIVELPVTLVQAPIGIYRTIQLAFVIVTGLFAYKIIIKPDKATTQGTQTNETPANSQGATNQENTGPRGTSYGATNQGNTGQRVTSKSTSTTTKL